MMKPAEAHLMVVKKYIYSLLELDFGGQPEFLLEILFGILLLTIYCYLIMEVKRIYKAENNYYKMLVKKLNAKILGHEKDLLEQKKNMECEETESMERFEKCRRRRSRSVFCENRISALSPADFVRLNKHEQICSMNSSTCLKSLTKCIGMYENQSGDEPKTLLMKDKSFQRNLMKRLASERVTENLVEVLNEIIEDIPKDAEAEVMSPELKTFVRKINNHELPKCCHSRSETNILSQFHPTEKL